MNALYCPACKTVIVSIHRHDFVGCRCTQENGTWVAVDGGQDYLRRAGAIHDCAEVTAIRTINGDLTLRGLAACPVSSS